MQYTNYLYMYMFLSSAAWGTHSKPVRETVSLSPSLWPSDTLRRLETISLRKNPRPKPLAFSKVQGLVSGTASALAVHAGTEALRKGGNAMDACITTAMAEISLTAGAEVSFAGVANILYYDHVTGRAHNLDAGWKIPKYRNWKQRPTIETLGDSVLVPGIIAGMYEAAEFSKFPLATLLEPALYFAEEGFKMPHRLSKMVHKYYKNTLLRTNAGYKIFTNFETKKPYAPTELFRQPQLAQFIRNIQQYGNNYMYRGAWTKSFIKTVRKYGGKMAFQDMDQYEAQWLEPASTTYSGYHVTTSGSDWGGVELVEMLNLLRLAGLSNTNDTYLTNATTLLSLISISRYSQFISDYLHEKPDGTKTIDEFFHVDATPNGRISNKSAEAIWSHLNNIEGRDMINEYIKELLSDLPNIDYHRERKRGSAGIVAIDNDGNVCAMTHTANTRPWGTGLFVDGVALPHSGAVFQDLVVHLRPGSRVPSGLQPVIIFKDITTEVKNHKVEERNEIPVRVTEHPFKRVIELNLQPRLVPRGWFQPPRKNGREIGLNKIPELSENPIQRQTEEHYRPRIIPNEFRPPSLVIRGLHGTRLKSSLWSKVVPQRKFIPYNVRRKHGNIPRGNWIEETPVEEENSLEENKMTNVELEAPIESDEEEDEDEEEKEEKDFDEKKQKELQPIVEEEPQTIGGLFTENDINSIFGKQFLTKDRRLKDSRKQWFQNIVRQIFQREKKNRKLQKRKMKFKKKAHKHWAHPIVALAVIGQSSAETTLQYINNLLDNVMNAKQASDSPMFFSSSPGSSRQVTRVERFMFSSDVISDVRSRGLEVEEVMHKSGRVITSAGAVLTVTEGKHCYGCSHPESEGFAESQ